MLTQRPRHAPTDNVLQHRDDEGEDEEGEDQRTAAPQQRQAGREPDRGEEGVLRRHLQRGVELQRLDAGEVEDREKPCHGKPAAHRRGDVHLAEDWDQSPDPVAGKQDDTGKRNGLNEIEGDRQHECREPLPNGFAHSPTGAQTGGAIVPNCLLAVIALMSMCSCDGRRAVVVRVALHHAWELIGGAAGFGLIRISAESVALDARTTCPQAQT